MASVFRILLLASAITMTTSAAVKIEKISYQGWPNCYRITNGEIEMVVTGDVGPRIIRFGFPGGQNLFKEYRDQLGKSGESEWMIRGGHRLWVAPENAATTTALDNVPVEIDAQGGVLVATEPVEPATGLQKQIIVRMAAAGASVELVHRVKNTTPWAVEFAPWALTVMAQGGTGITGFPPRGTHPEALLPTNPLVMWAYTDFSDPRWRITKKYLTLRQDPQAATPQKAGLFNARTWAAYLLGSELFLKQTAADAARTYADFGCSLETFTNADMLELETLGPLQKVGPGQTAEHVERWSLHKNVSIREWTDAELDAAVGRLLGK
jgi:hypothetical protein